MRIATGDISVYFYNVILIKSVLLHIKLVPSLKKTSKRCSSESVNCRIKRSRAWTVL